MTMGCGSSQSGIAADPLPTQQVVSMKAPKVGQKQAANTKPPVLRTDLQEAKVPAFWDKGSFRLGRAEAGDAKHLWDFTGDLTAEVPCELSVYFHCREKRVDSRLDWTAVEEGGPPTITRSLAAGKQQVLLNEAFDVKKWPLEVYFKFKKEDPDVIPIVFSLVADNVQLVNHLSVQVEGTSLQCAMLRQKAVINGAEYNMEEVYGLNSVSKEHDNNDIDGACVICLSDPRNTVVLPCQHLCLCEDCAGQLQAAKKDKGDMCPICRGPIAGIRVFDVTAKSAGAAAPESRGADVVV